MRKVLTLLTLFLKCENEGNLSQPSLIFAHHAQIVVEGCGHGSLDEIYAAIKVIQRKDKIPVDLLIICGDFEVLPHSVYSSH